MVRGRWSQTSSAPIWTIQQKDGAGLGGLENVDPLQETELVAGDEIRPRDQVVERIGSGPKRRCDVVTEPDFFES